MGLTVTQEVEAHCDGIGNCNGIQGSGSGGIPKNQGSHHIHLTFRKIRNPSADHCHTYETTDSDMSVSLSAISPHSTKHHLHPNRNH
jgi:hypothetical protein